MYTNPKHIFTETTKFRILVVMFKHYTLDNNGISMLANPSSGSFQQLMGNIIVYQPDLKELGDSLRGILESFVSNQNSRLFCALADLFEWYRAGMSYSILQLTKKHINSIFKRPPYEERPYTQELTYAQRLIMIYHVLNCEPWDTLMQAYDSLYQSLHNKPWQNKSKFLRADGARSTVAAASYRIIEECNKTVFTPQLFTMDPRLLGIFPPTSSILSKDTVRDGRVSKRRSISSISKTKNTKAVKFFGQGKPRSISLASASEGQSTGFYGLSANNMFPLVPCASVGPSWIGQQLNSSFVPRNENADPCQTMASLIAQSTPFPLIDSSQSTQQTFDSSFYSADTLTTSLNSQTSFSQTQQDQQQQNQLFYSSQELPLPIYHGTAAFQQSPLGIFRANLDMIHALNFANPRASTADNLSVNSLVSLPTQQPLENVDIPLVTNETLLALSEQLSHPGHSLLSSNSSNCSSNSGYTVPPCTSSCSSQDTVVAQNSLAMSNTSSNTPDNNKDRIQQQASLISTTATQSSEK